MILLSQDIYFSNQAVLPTSYYGKYTIIAACKGKMWRSRMEHQGKVMS